MRTSCSFSLKLEGWDAGTLRRNSDLLASTRSRFPAGSFFAPCPLLLHRDPDLASLVKLSKIANERREIEHDPERDHPGHPRSGSRTGYSRKALWSALR